MMPHEGVGMGFRYTEIGALMNEDKFVSAAAKLVDLLVKHEVDKAAEEKRALEPRANKAACARALSVDYRTVTRWVSILKDKGHDVVKQAEAKLATMQKEQRAA